MLMYWQIASQLALRSIVPGFTQELNAVDG